MQIFVKFHFFVKLFETCFIVANDDLEGKTIHFTGFYTHTISRPKIPKPPIVNHKHKAKLLLAALHCITIFFF